MAKTRPDIDRKEKRDEILAVARRLFAEAGYDVTSMSRIAEESGVAPNTIYWYFADKDALLIAVLNAVIADGMHEYQGRTKGSSDGQIMWLLGVLESVQSLIGTIHARLPVSEALRAWHANFHRVAEATLRAQMSARGMPADQLGPAARVYMFVVEGLLAHPTANKERQAIAKWFVALLRKANRDPSHL